MLSWCMKSPVQAPFGNAFSPSPCSSNNPIPSNHIPVTLVPSSIYALFFATALRNSPGISSFRTLSIVTGVAPAKGHFLFSIHLPKKGQTMNPQAPSSNSAATLVKADPKCHHVTLSGRQCRLRAIRSGLCFRHAALQLQSAQPVDVDLSADFLGQLDDLQSAEQINQFLAKLLILVVQNRISAVAPPSSPTSPTSSFTRSLLSSAKSIASLSNGIGPGGPNATTRSQTLWRTVPSRMSPRLIAGVWRRRLVPRPWCHCAGRNRV